MSGFLIPLALTAVTIGATLLAAQQEQKAASAQKKENQILRQGQDAEIRRQRVLEISRARRQRATALAFAEASGVNAVGSSVVGGINSVQSQSAGNQAFLTSQRDFANKAGEYRDKASKAETRAGQYNLLSSLGQFGLNTYNTQKAEFEQAILAAGGGGGGG